MSFAEIADSGGDEWRRDSEMRIRDSRLLRRNEIMQEIAHGVADRWTDLVPPRCLDFASIFNISIHRSIYDDVFTHAYARFDSWKGGMRGSHIESNRLISLDPLSGDRTMLGTYRLCICVINRQRPFRFPAKSPLTDSRSFVIGNSRKGNRRMIIAESIIGRGRSDRCRTRSRCSRARSLNKQAMSDD